MHKAIFIFYYIIKESNKMHSLGVFYEKLNIAEYVCVGCETV